jgi:hypothetical protein
LLQAAQLGAMHLQTASEAFAAAGDYNTAHDSKLIVLKFEQLVLTYTIKHLLPQLFRMCIANAEGWIQIGVISWALQTHLLLFT